ncbi:MAG: hypothetical protein OXI54_13970 [Chloroflexota bacterium]|nr:hypothetical protein [Chloroflexota bacterium]MDE2685234.1 hypothetical protein [Chloroflexota bacterium]
MKNDDGQRARNVTILTESRGGGQSSPRTPSGQRNRWQPPQNPSTAANRGALETAIHSHPSSAPYNHQSATPQSTDDPVWHTPYLAAERAQFGHWELVVQPTENGNSWEWTATLPDWEGEDGKQFQGASFNGRSLTKEDAKEAARKKASTALLS